MANLDPLRENTCSGVFLLAQEPVSLGSQINYTTPYRPILNFQQQGMSHVVPVTPPSYPTWPQDNNTSPYEPGLCLEQQQGSCAVLITPSLDATQSQDGFVSQPVHGWWLEQPYISYTPPPVLASIPEQQLGYATPNGPGLGPEQSQLTQKRPLTPAFSGQQEARSFREASGQSSASQSPKKKRRRFAKTLSTEDIKNPTPEQVNEFNSKTVQMGTFLEGARSIHKKPRMATSIPQKKPSQPKTLQKPNHFHQIDNNGADPKSGSYTTYIPNTPLQRQQTGLHQFRPNQATNYGFNYQSQIAMPNVPAHAQVISSYDEQNAFGRMIQGRLKEIE